MKQEFQGITSFLSLHNEYFAWYGDYKKTRRTALLLLHVYLLPQEHICLALAVSSGSRGEAHRHTDGKMISYPYFHLFIYFFSKMK
jgi:hypothetical protein